MSRTTKEAKQPVQSVLSDAPKIERIRCYQTVELKSTVTTGFNCNEYSIVPHATLPGFLVKKLSDPTDAGTIVFFSNVAYARLA